MIQKVSVSGFLWILRRFGSLRVINETNSCSTARMHGMPNTANALPEYPSACPFAPQCVAICSGSRFHTMRPNRIGSSVISVVMIV